MSFPKAKNKRFNEISSCAPPPGFYNPNVKEKVKGALIDKDLKRFNEQADCGASSLDTSTASNLSSYGSLESLTPRKSLFGIKGDVVKTRKPSGSCVDAIQHKEMELEMKRLVRERNDLDRKVRTKEEEMSKLDGRLQQVLKDKLSLESGIASLKKELATVKKANEHLKQNLQEEIKKGVVEATAVLREEQEVIKTKHKEDEKEWRRSVATLEEVIDRTHDNHRSLEDFNKCLEKEVAELKKSLKDLEVSKFENEDFIRHLKGEVFAHVDAVSQETEALQEAEEELTEVLAELRELKLTEELLNDNIKNMTTKYATLEQDLVTMETESKDREDQLERDLSGLRQSYEETKASCESLQQTNNDLSAKLLTEQESRHSLDRHVKEVCRSRDEVTCRLEEAQNALDVSTAQNTLLQSQLQTLSWDKGSLEARLTETSQSLGTAQRERDELISSYEDRMKDIRGQIVMLKDSVDNKQRELNEIISFKSHLQKTVEQLQNELLFVKEQNRTREFLLQEQEKENCRELERAQSAERKALQEHRVLLEQKRQWERDREELEGRLKQRSESEQHQIAELKEKLRLSTLSLAECRQQCGGIEHRLTEREEEVTVLMETATNSQQLVGKLEASVSQKDDELEAVKQNLVDIRDRCEELETKIAERNSELNDTKKQSDLQILELERKLTVKVNELDSLKNESKYHNVELERRVAEKDDEVASLKKSVAEIITRTEELEKKLTAKREELEVCSKLSEERQQKCEVLETKLNGRDWEMEGPRMAEVEAERNEWKEKFEALYQKVLPFQEQLEAFESERQALLGISSNAQKEVDKLSRDYAKLLGHQNQKQKIHHILKIKEENNALKVETTKLREQTLRQKRQISKLEEQLKAADSRKKFDSSKAFQHSKENNPTSAVLKEGNRR